MADPLFTYAVDTTPWYVVVGKGASHFYYNAESRDSVWQLSDTGIADFASKVNFDELAVLFAKANGVWVGPPAGQRKRRMSGEKTGAKRRQFAHKPEDTSSLAQDPNGGDNAPDTAEPVAPVEDTGRLGGLEGEKSGEIGEISRVSPSEDSHKLGLDLGYSSSSDEEFGEDERNGAVSGSDSFESDDDLNQGLDLAFDSEEEPTEESESSAKKEFENLLEEFSGEISTYDPWFLVEEELLPRFSQNPAFYGVDPTERERIFDAWVASRGSGEKNQETSQKTFPTPKLLVLRFLQDFKPEVRKLYFPEFAKRHPEIGSFAALDVNPESIYRELRVTLNDYAEHEKTQKKQKTEGNLKVAHVEKYLQQKLGKLQDNAKPKWAPDENAAFFDQWMHLCNHFSVPETVANDTTNFVLGDKKRLEAYLRVLAHE